MKIQPKQITIRELCAGFKDSGEQGVIGFNGKLNIRPIYQRNWVYPDYKRNKVIETVRNGYPLNIMYWVRNPDPIDPEDDSLAKFEVLDGQQRTLSICKYIAGDFSINERCFHNLTQDQKDKILDYEMIIYVCEGLESEKLDWFKTINIAGEKLTDQELLNAVYTGPWLTHAKGYFSKTNCPASILAADYVTGSPIRQEILELALNWINNGNPENYMSKHQHDSTAIELWNYFNSVVNWIKATFPKTRKEMKNVQWGPLFNKYGKNSLDPANLEKRINELMIDDDVTKKYGIYEYLLSGDEKHLNIRQFTEKMKTEAYSKQSGVCANKKSCQEKGRHLDISEMEADHIDPWHLGGKTNSDNCQMLCKKCNRRKSGI